MYPLLLFTLGMAIPPWLTSRSSASLMKNGARP